MSFLIYFKAILMVYKRTSKQNHVSLKTFSDVKTFKLEPFIKICKQ